MPNFCTQEWLDCTVADRTVTMPGFCVGPRVMLAERTYVLQTPDTDLCQGEAGLGDSSTGTGENTSFSSSVATGAAHHSSLEHEFCTAKASA